MTARELARAVGHDDAWISGVLKGAHGIHWKDFDAVASKLNLTPSELVRHDDDELRELTPSEMKLLRYYRTWPKEIQQRTMDLLDHFASTTPEPDVAALLAKVRRLPGSVRRPVLAWLGRLLEEGPQPAIGPAIADLDAIGGWLGNTTTPPSGSTGTIRGGHGRAAHPKK